jgi:hypothetical protein
MANYAAENDSGALKGFLKEFNEWVFGDEYYPNQKPGMLFVQGNINDPAVRKESHTIKSGEPIIVHIVGTNFIRKDRDSSGKEIDDDNKIRRACQDEEGADQCDFVKIKGPGDKDWTDLKEHIVHVRTSPEDFTASANNPDLGKWNPPMPPGRQRGAWSSKMLVLKLPDPGVYELSYEGHAANDYRQLADFKITVQ